MEALLLAAAAAAGAKSAEQVEYEAQVAAQIAEAKAGYTAEQWETVAAYEAVLYG